MSAAIFRDYIAALKAFSVEPQSKFTRMDVGASRIACDGIDIDAAKWPSMTRLALHCGHEIMMTSPTEQRMAALGKVAAMIVTAEAGDLGGLSAPTSECAPIRQYKDD